MGSRIETGTDEPGRNTGSVEVREFFGPPPCELVALTTDVESLLCEMEPQPDAPVASPAEGNPRSTPPTNLPASPESAPATPAPKSDRRVPRLVSET